MRYKVIENKQNNETKEKEKLLKLVNNGLHELYSKKWKYIFVALYTTVAFFLWNFIYALWVIFPFNNLPKLVYNVISIIYFGIAITLLILLLLQVVIYIGKASHCFVKKRCITGFRRCGLKTKTDEVPPLVDVYNDTEKLCGRIYLFENLQIPIEKFKENTSSIQLILKGQVYDMDYAENTDYTHINIIPNKYVMPYIIGTYKEEFKEWLNLLVVGKTRLTVSLIVSW